jgi:hypothetical protein
MSLVVFAGPSLPPEARAGFTGLDWRPPAEAGDLLRLPPGPDLTICLIDGYFDHRPAVRHKEILYHLAAGTRIYGAASIGALRAAEMDAFGMVGVGAIYGAFRRGSLTGDDEVALIHTPAERGWRALSMPMVDVRATLAAARRARIVAASEARALLEAAAAFHYVDRDWPAVLARAPHPAFAAWLPSGAVDLKRRDATACLSLALSGTHPAPPRPEFVRTIFFDALAKEVGVEI